MNGSRSGHPLHLTISTVDSADDERLQTALVETTGRDSRVKFSKRPQDGVYDLAGRTESSLASICDHLRDEYHLAIQVSPIEVVFLETIRKQAEGEGKYIRQTGGSGNYGHCKIRIEPNEAGRGYEFINDLHGEVVPKQYIQPIEQGIQDAMEMGILHGFPVVDVRVTLFDGSYHEADSNEMAFKFAGSIAFKEAARKASPVLLEPVMAVETTVPDKLMGATISDLNSRRGRIVAMEHTEGSRVIQALVPLEEILNTAPGFADYSIEFVGYEPAPSRGPSDDNAAGVTANKPSHPRSPSRPDAARSEQD